MINITCFCYYFRRTLSGKETRLYLDILLYTRPIHYLYTADINASLSIVIWNFHTSHLSALIMGVIMSI